MNRRFLSIALLGAALQLTASLSVAMGLVVCSKGSGHVAIESGLNDECCGNEAATALQGEVPSGDEHCVDTPVVQGSIDSSPARGAVLARAQAPLLPAPMSVVVAAPTPWTHAVRRFFPRNPSLDLYARSSIVLLV